MSYLKHKPGSIEEIMANQNQKLNDNAYQDMFKKELDKAGRGIGAMSPKEKKDFFDKIDDKYKAKNEEIQERKNYKYNSNFFVNDKTDTLKKFNGRKDYNKSTLTDYLAQKTNKKEDDVYFDDTELVYKDKTVLKNAETKTVAQMLQALKNEEVEVPAGSHKMPEETIIERSSQVQVKRDGKGNFNLIWKGKEIGYYHKSGSKYMVYYDKDGDDYNQSDEVPSELQAKNKAYDAMNEEDAYDKDDEKPKNKPKPKKEEVKETHTGQTKKANNHQRSANGEKEVIKSGAKLKFKEAYKKVKENPTTTDDSTQDRANQGDSLDDTSTDPDIKKPKGKAATGSKPTPVDTSPEIEYKN